MSLKPGMTGTRTVTGTPLEATTSKLRRMFSLVRPVSARWIFGSMCLMSK